MTGEVNLDIQENLLSENQERNENKSQQKSANITLISQLEPKKVNETLEDERWIKDMEEELEQFDKSKVLTLVPKSKNTSIIRIDGSSKIKWINQVKQIRIKLV